MKKSNSILLGVSSAVALLGSNVLAQEAPDTQDGFFEGQNLQYRARSFLASEWYDDKVLKWKDGAGKSHPTDRRTAWNIANMLEYSSGYTRGPIGVGVNLSGHYVVNLLRGRERLGGGGNRAYVRGDGSTYKGWGVLGNASLKLRASKTTLLVGRDRFVNPVLDVNDNRAAPGKYHGVMITSKEIDKFTLHAGYLNAYLPKTSKDTRHYLNLEYGGTRADHYGVAGLTWQPSDGLTLELYGSQLDNVMNQYYFGGNGTWGDRDNGLGYEANFMTYYSKDTGSSRAGRIDNFTYSADLGIAHQAHKLVFAFQHVTGDEPFDYLGGSGGVKFSNSMVSDYNGPREKSVQVRYETDWSYLGAPGLSTALWYVYGWGIDGTHYKGGAYDGYVSGLKKNAKHWETALQVKYVVQDGAFSGTSFRLFPLVHKGHGTDDPSFKEIRLVVELPFKIL